MPQDLTCRYNSVLRVKEWRTLGRPSVVVAGQTPQPNDPDPDPTPPGDPLFAGHKPYRVLVGMGTAESRPLTFIGACPEPNASAAAVLTKYGNGSSIRTFSSGTFGAAVARPAGASNVHHSWKPTLGQALPSDAVIQAAVANLVAGDIVEVWHEADVKQRKGDPLAPMMTMKNAFHAAIVRMRNAGTIPQLRTCNTLAGWTVDSTSNVNPSSPDVLANADLLGIDMDGIPADEDFYAFAERQMGTKFTTAMTNGLYKGWSVPEFCMPSVATDPTSSRRIAWFRDQVAKVRVGVPAAGVAPPVAINWFDFPGIIGESEMLVNAAEVDAWSKLRPTRPSYTEARAAHVTGQSYVRHVSTEDTYTAAWLNTALSDAVAARYYPILSFAGYKNWLQISQGAIDADLTAIRNKAKTMRTAAAAGTPFPFAVGIHPEPDGDGVLADWSKMNIYCSNFFAGWTTNSAGDKVAYTAANDVSDIMAWHSIADGYWWGPRAYDPTKISAAYPTKLVATYAANRSILMADFDDPLPTNKTTVADASRNEPPFTFVTNADRTSRRITSFIGWARGFPKTPALGCGGFVTVTAEELTAVWTVMRDNRDVWALGNYFNSSHNARWDWRLIPDVYPAYNPDVHRSGTFVLRDYGGSTESERKLVAFLRMRDESTLPAYTGSL